MDTSRVLVLLEKIRDALGAQPVEQTKSAQMTKAPIAKAKKALHDLAKKAKIGRGKQNELKATGAAKRK